jgi:hypothetical protein
MEQPRYIRIPRFLYPSVFKKSGLDVLWEPSSGEVVDEVISLARVRSTDLLYDLGCGDGRIVIAAGGPGARRGGASTSIREGSRRAARTRCSRAGRG